MCAWELHSVLTALDYIHFKAIIILNQQEKAVLFKSWSKVTFPRAENKSLLEYSMGGSGGQLVVNTHTVLCKRHLQTKSNHYLL